MAPFPASIADSMIQRHVPKMGPCNNNKYLKNKRGCLLTSTKRSEYNIHITSGKKNLEILEQEPVHISLAVVLGL